MKMDTTWKERPANIRLIPVCVPEAVCELDAMPPPAAWRTREKRSHPQKMSVYVRGLKREIDSP